jgi:hypothetical protein
MIELMCQYAPLSYGVAILTMALFGALCLYGYSLIRYRRALRTLTLPPA